MKTLQAFRALSVVTAVGLYLGCAAKEGDGNPLGRGGGSANTSTEHSVGAGGAGGANPGSGGGFGFGGTPTTCENLECKQVACAGATSTTLRGTVIAPTPTQYGPADPIYNAIVYVPNAPVEPFAPGVSCEQCGAPASGDPLVVALTDAKGEFVLSNVPAGSNIPLVIQVGRWRRQVIVPEIQECTETVLPTELTRLPRNKTEGDIPHFAIASSPHDPEECILRKIGIDDSEFTSSTGDGRVHLYQGGGASIPGTATAASLWSDLDLLKTYDMVLFPCGSVDVRGSTGLQNVFEYANLGGRVFATDLSYAWFKSAPEPWPSAVQWTDWTSTGVSPLPATVDQSFPKGQALTEWLQNLGATQTPGAVALLGTYHVVDAVNPPTTRWLYSDSPATVQAFSFNTPIGATADQQCGRAVYSNFHIAEPSNEAIWPEECSPEPLTPQEKVLEFMLFDLASCVQEDAVDPIEPPL